MVARAARHHIGGDGDGFRQFGAPPSAEPSPPPAFAAAAATAATVADKAGDAVGFAKSHWVVLVVVAGIVALALLLWWLVGQALRTTHGVQNSSSLVPVPESTDVYRKFPGKGLPASTNGQRLSLSFWIYVSDFSKNDGAFRHVLHVGQEDGSLASPLVFLDRNRNRLIVWFAKTDTRASPNPDVGALLRGPAANVKLNFAAGGAAASGASFDVNRHGVVIPYVPQQRWVHVALVVDETVQATTITGYVDGEVAVQSTTGDLADDVDGFPLQTSRSPGTTLGASSAKDLRGLNLTLSAGDLYTGGDAYGKAGVGFPGYVSRVSFYNYELNADDVLGLYRSGPYPQSWFGLGAYGLRTPVYKLADAQ